MRYHLLIVDDEPYILSWLSQIFLLQSEWDLEVCRAESSEQAMKILEQRRIDIVLSDIMMPGMDGMELSRKVLERWPSCKFIFLTAHGKFEFAYQAIESGVIDFVLKIENDDRIVDSVRKAIEIIERERRSTELMREAEQQQRNVLPMMRNLLLARIFCGGFGPTREARDRLREYGLPLDPDGPYFLSLLRFDRSPSHPLDIPACAREYIFICSVLDRKLGSQARTAAFTKSSGGPYSGERTVCCLIQPFPGKTDTAGYIRQSAEDLHTTLSVALDAELSIALSLREIRFAEFEIVLSSLETLLNLHGMEKGVILTDRQPDAGGIADNRKNGAFLHLERQMAFFRQDLLAGNAELCGKHMERCAGLRGISVETQQQVFADISLILTSAASQLNLDASLTHDLRPFGSFPGPEAAFASLRETAERLCRAVRDNSREALEDVVSRVKGYVTANIGGDLSLEKMSDSLFYNPSYLSRIFRIQTGMTISQYISQCKISKIKELLDNPSLRIKDIAEQTGFESPAYFSRFFRSKTGLSAQEYRTRNG